MKTCIKHLLLLPILVAGIGLTSTNRLSAQIITVLHNFTMGSINADDSYINSDGAYPVTYTGLVSSEGTLYGTTSSGGTNGEGTVFAINTDGTGFRILHVFDGSDGVFPNSLILSGNTLYGTTASGGNGGTSSDGAGTVFAINTDGTEFREVYAFGGWTDGAEPNSLILSTNTLYGTSIDGYFGATVFAVNTNGTGFSTLHTFSGGYDGATTCPGLVLSGNALYGTTIMGGSGGDGTVFTVNTDGSGFQVLHGFSVKAEPSYINSDGANPNAGLVLSGSTLYGTTVFGGADGDGVIFAVQTNGAAFTTLYNFGNTGSEFPQTALILSDNALYGIAGQAFSINTDGSDFTVMRNPANPVYLTSDEYASSLLLLSNTLYGVTYSGGSNDDGSVFSLALGPGSVETQIYPASVIAAGAQWDIDSEGIWMTNGTIITNLPTGSHTINFSAVPGWITPASQIITVTNNAALLVSGTYTVLAPTFTSLYNFSAATFSGDTYQNYEGVGPTGTLVLISNTLYGTANGGGPDGVGAVFSVNTDGSDINPIYHFSGIYSGNDDGAGPIGLVSSSNTLYGVTSEGGGYGYGTIFSMDTNGTLTYLHSFADQTDGENPSGGLILSGNTVYGTAAGGAYGGGTIYKINTDGSGFDILYSFTGGSDGGNPLGNLALSGNTLYGTAEVGGGTNGEGTVFKINTDGSDFSVLHVFKSSSPVNGTTNSDGFNPYGGLTASGNVLYGTAYNGGPNGRGTVFSLNTDGTGFAVLYAFSPLSGPFGFRTNIDGAGPMDGLLLSGGTLYGTALAGGSIGDGTVFAVNTDGSEFTVLHAFTNGVDGSTPVCNLILSDDTLYGMAAAGGSNDAGTVFTITLPTRTNYAIVVNASPDAGGMVSGAGIFAPGSLQTVSATANAGYTFAYWAENGIVVSSSPTYTFTVTSNIDLAANFATNTINDVVTVDVLPTGGGTISPDYNDQSLQAGNSYAMTARAAKGFKFTGWSGSLDSASAKLTFTMEPGLSFTANFTETTRPLLVVVYPPAKGTVSNSVIAATGKTRGSTTITAIYYQLNSNPWTQATGTTNWSAPDLLLNPGTNVIRAYAQDADGNVSLTNTILFNYVVTAPLTVAVDPPGSGTISPDDNDQPLVVNESYTMTAKAAKGFSFVGWSGDVSSSAFKLNFTMKSNLTLTANFKDIQRPTCVVSYPPAKHTITNDVITATGKAGDNVAVAAVYYQFNTNGWTLADGTTNWFTPGLVLNAGTNIVRAFAVDTSTNISLTNTITFKH